MGREKDVLQGPTAHTQKDTDVYDWFWVPVQVFLLQLPPVAQADYPQGLPELYSRVDADETGWYEVYAS